MQNLAEMGVTPLHAGELETIDGGAIPLTFAAGVIVGASGAVAIGIVALAAYGAYKLITD
jgi:hypothetical protein